MEGMSLITRWIDGETLPLDLDTPRPEENAKNIEAGRVIYEMRCAVCHGKNGEGDGPKAKELTIKPANFASGIFKFRSTTDVVPADLDIFKTITRGLHGTAMLPWPGLTTLEKWQVTYYIKTLSDLFEKGEVLETVEVPAPIMSRPQYLKLAREAYTKAKCYECHGQEGRGDGTKANELKDDWHRPISPTNFREQIPKRGRNLEEIYLTIATGLNGTPMRSFAKILTPEEMLALAYYIQSITPVPEGVGIMTGMSKMAPEEQLGIMIDHVMTPTVYRPEYFR